MLTFSILGPVDLRDSHGREICTVLSAPKRLALLACLALKGPRRFCRRDYLLGLLWPEKSPAAAHHALRNTLYEVRSGLGGRIVLNRGTGEVALSGDEFWCDVWAFDAALRGGRLEEVLDMYRGDLMEGFHVCGTLEFERCLEEERRNRARGYERALAVLAEQAERAGDLDKAIGLLSRLAAREPYDSRVTLRLMRGLVASGDRVRALRQAEVHRTILYEELGLEQDPEVDALASRIRAGVTRTSAGSLQDARKPGIAHLRARNEGSLPGKGGH